MTAGARFEIASGTWPPPLEVQDFTGLDGVLRLPRLPPGTYEMEVEEPGEEQRIADVHSVRAVRISPLEHDGRGRSEDPGRSFRVARPRVGGDHEPGVGGMGLEILAGNISAPEQSAHNRERGKLSYSRTILNHVVAERRTFYQSPEGEEQAGSLMEVEAVAASPIFDATGGEVVGAVYGSRSHHAGGMGAAIQPLEAQLLQVLAAAVGAGLARLEQEAEASRRHVQFEQFFSPELAKELDRDPSLLEGRDREVTIPFSDLRGFSRVSERLTPRVTCQLISSIIRVPGRGSSPRSRPDRGCRASGR